MSITNVTGGRSDISEMLSKMREISTKTQVFSTNNVPGIKAPNAVPAKSFEDALSAVKDVFSHVSTLQSQTEDIKNAYIAGDKNVSMSQVLVAAQKSKLAFEGLVTVRNKILEAYKEIMNMPV
jgi:flagellar hook-basal body complex protein FliE